MGSGAIYTFVWKAPATYSPQHKLHWNTYFVWFFLLLNVNNANMCRTWTLIYHIIPNNNGTCIKVCNSEKANLLLNYFYTVCSLPPSSPACLTLLNSELWHQVKAFGSTALLWRTRLPGRFPCCWNPGRKSFEITTHDLPGCWVCCACALCGFCTVVAHESPIPAWPCLSKVYCECTYVVFQRWVGKHLIWFQFLFFVYF